MRRGLLRCVPCVKMDIQRLLGLPLFYYFCKSAQYLSPTTRVSTLSIREWRPNNQQHLTQILKK